MKITLLASLLVLATTGAIAELRFGGGAHVGFSFSSFAEPTSQFYGVGFGGGANADLDVMKYLTVRLDADYFTFPSDKGKLKSQISVTDVNGRPLDFSVAGANLSALGVSLNAVGKIPTRSMVTPYGILGVGMNFGSGSDFTITTGGKTVVTQPIESKTNFGFDFGAGSEFRVGSTRLVVEAKYVLILAEGGAVGHIPVTFGVEF